MLGKLVKYELKATSRTFISLYIAILVVAVINGLTMNIEMFEIPGLGFMILSSLITALAVITVIVIVQRFNKSLLNDEGYLMFTLPVKSKSIILSKYITSLIWGAISIAVSILAFKLVSIVLSLSGGSMGVSFMIDGNLDVVVKTIMEEKNWGAFVGMLLMVVCAYSVFTFSIYQSLAIGQLPMFSKYKIPVAFISFFIINAITSAIGNISNSNMRSGIDINIDIISNGLYTNLFINLVIVICLFIGTSYILEKKLNLE